MKTRIKYISIAFALLGSFIVVAGAAEGASDSTQKQKTKRIPVADFADDARMDVLRWLVKLEPAFATFQARFTYARPIFEREDAYSPRVSVIVILPLTKSTVTFIASAEFSDDLSKASKSRIDAFSALVSFEGKRYTVKIPPSEMNEFAADPDKYLEKAVVTGK
jgi:hypothetical protein